MNRLNSWLKAYRELQKKEEEEVSLDVFNFFNSIFQEDKIEIVPEQKDLELLKGWLKKQGDDKLKGFKNKYFKQDSNKLYFYKSDDMNDM